MRGPAALLLATGLALSGCGGDPGELITITTTGGGEPTQRLVVEADSRGACDGGAERTLPSQLVLDARQVERELGKPARERASYTDGPRGARRYTAATKEGIVTWTEGARSAPPVISKAIQLRQSLKRELCG